ncbi:MAG: SRPBCC family protein [Alphaproteobacteria bacterium]|nr:SRPBCC family protein [Alphaproteobacteria bacterium]
MSSATPRSVVHASFTITRHWKAAPARVFQAFADQAAKDAWFARAPNLTRTRREFDFREGGREISEGRWDSGVITLFDCHYHDIVPDARIIYSYAMYLDGRKISVSQACIELVPEGTGTKFILTEYGDYLDGYEDKGSREHGTNALMDQLAASIGG